MHAHTPTNTPQASGLITNAPKKCSELSSHILNILQDITILAFLNAPLTCSFCFTYISLLSFWPYPSSQTILHGALT